MADSNPTDCAERHPAGEDAKAERVVLAPTRRTSIPADDPRAARALNAHPGFSSDDAVERAVRELVGAGLLYCQGRFVLLTRAPLYFARLESD